MANTELLLRAKKKKRLSFADIGKSLGRHKIWVSALFYGQAQASEDEVNKLAEILGVDTKELEDLTDSPVKGSLTPAVPTDPLIYRLYEIVQVYGLPIKAVVNEEFGDGIVSAIDFTMDIQRQEDPKGDRVVITLNGKFLPYKKW
jgi:cyanate lyase